MKIVTTLYDEDGNVVDKISSLSWETHEEKLFHIQRAAEQVVENEVNEMITNNELGL